MKRIAVVQMSRTGEFHTPNGALIRVSADNSIEVFPNPEAKAGDTDHFDAVFRRIVRAICAPLGEAQIALPEFLQFDEKGGECCTAAAYTQSSETGDPPPSAAPSTPSASTSAPNIGGVPVASATPPPERKTRGRKPKPEATETHQPPPATPADGGPPSPFTQEMAKIDAAQRPADWLPKEVVIVAEAAKEGVVDPTKPVTFEPLDNDMNVGQAPPVASVDWFLELFQDPPLPPDLSPLDSRRSLSSREFLDTCYTRALFQRPVALEQGKTSYEELLDTLPAEPVVDMSSDEGVRAFVEMLYAVQDRASKMGMEIPQIEAYLLLGTKEQVIAQAVDTFRRRRAQQ